MTTSSDCRFERASDLDLDAIHGLVMAVGWPHVRQDVEAALTLGRPWRAVDTTDDRLLGVAMWWPMGETAARVGLVIVASDAQGRGIGRTLMERVIDDVGPRAISLLATEAGRPLYQTLGFDSTGLSYRHLGEYRGELVLGPGVERLRRRDLDAVVELDGQAMGADRRCIIEHLVDVGDGVVLRAGGSLSGFAIRRPFGTGDVVGPIVARSEGQAAALFQAVARPGLVRVDRPAGARGFGELLDERGVERREVSQVMVRGPWPGNEATVESYAMASHAWG